MLQAVYFILIHFFRNDSALLRKSPLDTVNGLTVNIATSSVIVALSFQLSHAVLKVQ